MGFQSTITILNDSLHLIEEDPKAWWETTQAQIMGHRGQAPAPYAFKNRSNSFSVVSVHHADVTSVIAVGGNHATILGQLYQQDHHTPEAQVVLLKKLAAELGYKLVKKPGKGK